MIVVFPGRLAPVPRKLFFNIRNYTATATNHKTLLYVGPVNQMVSRMKTFSIGSAVVSSALAPALIYFSADHWSLFAKFGLVSTGTIYKKAQIRFTFSFIFVVLFTSYGTSYLFHLLIKKYVFTIRKGQLNEASAPLDHLLIEKMNFWGRKRIQSVPLNDLINGGSILTTWKSVKTGDGYLVQFVPNEEQVSGHQNQINTGNVTTYQGEKVDSDIMTKIYNEIANRR